ncbi:MAG: DUF2807 domain-containing protein [Kiritimatiellae bacterium]|nr:DUF2807 domain-containing protein [Kiritimatiellia bacterium]
MNSKSFRSLTVSAVSLAGAIFGFPAKAATPVAVWDRDFSTAVEGYTLNLNGNTLSSDNSTITITQASLGVDVNFTTAMTSGMTIIVHYGNLTTGSKDKMLATSCIVSDYTKDRTGIDLKQGGGLQGAFYNNGWADNGNVANSIGSSGYMAFKYKHDVGTYIYQSSTAGGFNANNWGSSGLKSSSDTSIYGVTVGGMRSGSPNNNWSAATDMTITGIAVFDSALSVDEMNSYTFPSAAASATMTVAGECSWSDTTKWDGGTAATSGNVTLNVTGGAVLTVDADVSIETVTVSGSGTLTIVAGSGNTVTLAAIDAGEITALNLKDINTSGAVTIAETGTVTNEVSGGGSVTCGALTCAESVKTGDGTLTFVGLSTATNFLVSAGTAQNSSSARNDNKGTGYGYYKGGTATVDELTTITVASGATLDLANTRGVCYRVISQGGAIKNSGSDIDTNQRQMTTLTLEGETTVSGNMFGLLGSQAAATTLATGGNTLNVAMNGGKSFILCNTTITGGGTINVTSGSLTLSGTVTYDATGATSGQALFSFPEGTEASASGISFTNLPEGTSYSIQGNQILLIDYVAKIGENTYKTLTDAVAAASGTDVINIVATTPAETLALTKNVTISNSTDVTINATISGDYGIVKYGEGTLTFATAPSTYTGGFTVAQGTAKTASSAVNVHTGSGFGKYPEGAAAANLYTITICAGATLDLANTAGVCYSIVSQGGTITNSGSDIGDNERQMTTLTLEGDTTITGNTFGLLGSGYASTTLTLNGHKLTVNLNSGKTFILCNTTISGSGTLEIASATCSAVRDKACAGTDEGFTLQIDSGATFSVPQTSACTFANVTNSGTINLSGGSFTVNGTYAPAAATATINNLTLAANSTLDVTVGAAAVTAAFAGTSPINVTGTGLVNGSVIVTGLENEPSSLPRVKVGGKQYRTVYDSTAKTLSLSFTALSISIR